MAEEEKKQTKTTKKDDKSTARKTQTKPKTTGKKKTTTTKPKKSQTKKAPGKSKPAAKKQTEKKTATEKTDTKKKTEEKTPEKKTATKPKKTEEPKESKPVKKDEETKEKKYQVKIKPKLSKDLKDSMQKRKEIKKRTPEFLREEWFRYKRVPKNWRRPDGITSKMRINLKYRPSRVRVGFRGPKDVRGFHPSGFEEIMVYNANDLEAMDPKTQAARIGGTVGTKKRIDIEKKADKLKIRILNRQGD